MKKILTIGLILLILAAFPAIATAAQTPAPTPPPVPNVADIELTVELQGLENLFVGAEVSGRILFELEGAQFAQEIAPEDFWVGNLPPGLVAEDARRIGNQLVEIRITGRPDQEIATARVLTTPARLHVRNIRHGQLLSIATIPITREGSFSVGSAAASSGIYPTAIFFDLNPYGAYHRDAFVRINLPYGFSLINIRYGRMNLTEETQFTRHPNNQIRIHSSFLNRMAIGEWELEFMMNRGANPTVRIVVIDTRTDEEPEEYEEVGPPPAPPQAPPHPDDSFMYLTGGIAVDLNSLHWNLNRARVTPEFHDGVATATVRANVLNYLAWERPGETFQILTPHARIRIPTDIFASMYGASAAVSANDLTYSQVDLRITIADRSGDERFNEMLEATYPYGEILSSLLEFRVELVCAVTDEIILTAQEFATPLELSFIVMDNAGHLRPAGVLFRTQWIEFVPYRSPSPNEFVLRTIFPGTMGVIHNRIHFEDIYSTHWGFVQSYTAAYSGLLVPTAQLSPDTPITRGEFAQLVASILQLPRASAHISGFTDVPPPNVFFDGVSRLFNAGLLGPYVPGSRFYPNSIITREEMASIVGMAIRLNDPVLPENSRPLLTFTDGDEFTQAHMHNVQATVDFGAMVGYPDNSFRPQRQATRIYALEATIRLARILGILDE
ncbi:MAG: S-layer homology domain-containing protein [Defluviitaleaceae bacterium]|nr:S-layer homology domain-containing protein [Defluviitaleaceae bacterium]